MKRAGAWSYEAYKNGDESKRAKRYREQLAKLKATDPERFEQIAFDAIYVDEGKFAPRRGQPPMLTLTVDSERELKLIVAPLALLIRDDRVRPQDILILTLSRDRANQIADAIEREDIRGIAGVQRAFKEKDSALCQPGCVTISTVHSAKGYDAFVVLLCSANEFRTDVKGRACFYVACTRAIERLEVFAYESSGLVRELNRLLQERLHSDS